MGLILGRLTIGRILRGFFWRWGGGGGAGGGWRFKFSGGLIFGGAYYRNFTVSRWNALKRYGGKTAGHSEAFTLQKLCHRDFAFWGGSKLC